MTPIGVVRRQRVNYVSKLYGPLSNNNAISTCTAIRTLLYILKHRQVIASVCFLNFSIVPCLNFSRRKTSQSADEGALPFIS